MISEENILELIGKEMKSILNSDNAFNGYSFCITNETQYEKDEELKNQKKMIFIVIKYYPATLNFGQIIMPIQLDVISEANKIDIAKRLLYAFAETYNLEFNDDYTIKQYFQSPSVLSNFNEIGTTYRSLMTMRGTLQISENSNLIKSISLVNGNQNTPLGFITSNVSFDVQLETQSLYNQDNITKSWARVGTLVLNFSIYLTNDSFCNKLLYIMAKDSVNAPDGIATLFKLKVLFKNEIEITQDFRLANATLQQNMGELPVINLTFTL